MTTGKTIALTRWTFVSKVLSLLFIVIFFGAPKSQQMVTAAMKSSFAPWKKSYGKPRQHIKKQDMTLPTKSKSKLWLDY